MDVSRVYPTHQLSYVGGFVRITCYSRIKSKWTKDGLPMPLTLALVASKYLLLHNVTLAASGIYTCHGSSIDEDIGRFTASSELIVAGNNTNILLYYVPQVN